MRGSGCINCPVKPCNTMRYRGSTCASQRAQYGLGDPMTIADKIRAMNDEELAEAISQLIHGEDPGAWYCKGNKECGELLEADKDIPESMCRACLVEKLRQPAEEYHRPVWSHEDKEESGLLEED